MTHDYVSYDYDYDYEADTNTVYVFSNAFQKKGKFSSCELRTETPPPQAETGHTAIPYHINVNVCVHVKHHVNQSLPRNHLVHCFAEQKHETKKQLDNHMQHAHICSQRNMKQIHRTTTCNM